MRRVLGAAALCGGLVAISQAFWNHVLGFALDPLTAGFLVAAGVVFGAVTLGIDKGP